MDLVMSNCVRANEQMFELRPV